MVDPDPTFNPVSMRLPGVHCIAASAGTGKTYAITALFLRYLLEEECPIEHILVTTYTEAATAELKDRVRNRLHEAQQILRRCTSVDEARGQVEAERADATIVGILEQAGAWGAGSAATISNRLDAAILDFDRAQIFTIHGFCKRVLDELVFETGNRFDLELVTSQTELVDKYLADFEAREWADEESALADLVPLESRLHGQMRKLSLAAVDNPDLTVVPESEPRKSLLKKKDIPLAEFREKVDELAKLWSRDGEQALDLVRYAVKNKWLSGKYFRMDWIEKSSDFIRLLIAKRSFVVFCLDDDGEIETYQRRLGSTYILNAIKDEYAGSAPKHHLFEIIDELVGVAKQLLELQVHFQTQALSQAASFVRGRVADHKQEQGVMSFSDLLHKVDAALQGPRSQADMLLESLRARYRVVLIDEFQDTDPVQCRIFQKAFQEAPTAPGGKPRAFVMIGDPKQSIYRFRGADIRSYLSATDQTPEADRHSMGTNWRSDRSLVSAVQAVFASADNPFLEEKIPLPPVSGHHVDRFHDGPALGFVFVEGGADADGKKRTKESDSLDRVLPIVASDIVAQLNRRPALGEVENETRDLTPGDVAVLCRTGKHLRLMQEEFARRGVPVVLQTEESIFDTPEAAAMVHVLRAMVEPGQRKWISNALQTPVFGLNADGLEQLRKEESEFSRRALQYHTWHATWRKTGFAAAWRQLFDQAEVLPRLARLMTGERQATNYLHLGELIHRHAVDAHAGPVQSLRWLENSIDDSQPRKDDESQLRLETDSAALRLCTIHKSKGLEYPVVYCPTLWHVYGGKGDEFVMARLDGQDKPLNVPEIDVGSPLHSKRQEWDKKEQQAEDRRLLYVALTRAKHQCFVYWTAINVPKREDAAPPALASFIFGGKAPEADADIRVAIDQWAGSLKQERVEFRVAPSQETLAEPDRYQPLQEAPKRLAARAVRRHEVTPLFKTSFSSLARGMEDLVEPEVADLDQAAAAGTDDQGDPPAQRPEQHGDLPLGNMPGGRKVGDLVHRVFENVLDEGVHKKDFVTVAEIIARELDAQLPRVQLDRSWRDPLKAAIAGCLTQPIALGDGRCRLSNVDPLNLVCEMHFVLRAGRDQIGMNPRAIGDALSLSSNPSVQKYAQRARHMEARRLRGFLEGFIDLIFEHDGKWYLADYKTNRLGSARAAYAPEQLAAAMHEHDYVLQYHIYAVALHLVLRQRVKAYDFQRHFGGAAYLFLRGLDPTGIRPDAGVYFDCPDDAVIESLVAVLAGEERP